MRCRKVRHYLFFHSDNEIDDVLRTKIDEHLKGCPTCSKELKELSTISSLFKELPEFSPSANFEEKLWEKINFTAYPNREKAPKKKSILAWGKFRWSYAVSLPVIMLVTFILVRTNFQSLKETKPQVFQSALSWQDLPVREKIDYETILPKSSLRTKGTKKSSKENPVFVMDNLKLDRDYQNLISKLSQRRIRTYPVSSQGNYYVLPMVSSQQMVQKVSY
jgi:hypothetical protein